MTEESGPTPQPGTSSVDAAETPPETSPEAALRALIKDTLMEVMRDIPALASSAHSGGSTQPGKSYDWCRAPVVAGCVVPLPRVRGWWPPHKGGSGERVSGSYLER